MPDTVRLALLGSKWTTHLTLLGIFLQGVFPMDGYLHIYCFNRLCFLQKLIIRPLLENIIQQFTTPSRVRSLNARWHEIKSQIVKGSNSNALWCSDHTHVVIVATSLYVIGKSKRFSIFSIGRWSSRNWTALEGLITFSTSDLYQWQCRPVPNLWHSPIVDHQKAQRALLNAWQIVQNAIFQFPCSTPHSMSVNKCAKIWGGCSPVRFSIGGSNSTVWSLLRPRLMSFAGFQRNQTKKAYQMSLYYSYWVRLPKVSLSIAHAGDRSSFSRSIFTIAREEVLCTCQLNTWYCSCSKQTSCNSQSNLGDYLAVPGTSYFNRTS